MKVDRIAYEDLADLYNSGPNKEIDDDINRNQDTTTRTKPSPEIDP